ncbi:MAG TPA: tetratricopeptide repeat protein [Terriglobales bacterium]|nr:tetratricopeptide repeat protein [Terriglobales bacterium]
MIDEVSRRTMTLASDEAAKAISTADPGDAAVLEKVSHWFAQHGVAWSGTPAELAGILGCPTEQLVHAIEVASATLLVSGIAGSVCKRPGLPTVICLRRLEEICDECEFSPDPCDTNPYDKAPYDTAPSQNLAAPDSNDAQSVPENVAEDNSQAPTEDLSPSADPGEAVDTEWRNKLVMGALTPVEDAADGQRGKFLWKALIVLALLFPVAMTSHRVNSLASRIGSRFKSLVARPAPESPREIAGNGTPRSDSGSPEETSPSTSPDTSALYERAKANDPAAQYTLGLKLLQGDGVPPNEADAITWFRQAAQRGNPSAEFQLGTAYMLGRGVRQDSVEGYTWLTLASKNGDTQAEQSLRELTPKLSPSEMARVRFNLAEMYRQGIGTGADKRTAYVWYVLAEAAGEKDSTKAKLDLARSMSQAQVADATAEAVTWLRRHRM